MADRAIVQEVNQIGVETLAAPGTAVPALILLQAMHFALAADAEVDMYGPDGQKYDTLSIVNKEWTGFEISGRPTYSEIIYFLASLLTDPVITVPGGGTNSRRWTFSPSSTAPDAPRTYTIEQGVKGATAAERAAFGIIREGTITFDRNGGNELSGAGIAQRLTLDVPLSTNEIQTLTMTGGPTGGTFTLTFDGQTTAGIAYNATAAAVQAALEALSNIAVGDVLCAGGALPTTPVTVEFRGVYAQTNVSLMTANSSGLTGGTTPTLTPTTTTPGVAPTATELRPIAPTEVSIYVDDTSGALGTTKLLRDFIFTFQLGDRFNPIYPLNSAVASYDGIIEVKPSTEVHLTMGNDAVGRAFLATMRAGTTKYIRAEAIGPIIEGAITYRLRIDVAAKVSAAPEAGDVDGLSTLEWTFHPVHDAGWGRAFQVEVQNIQTAL